MAGSIKFRVIVEGINKLKKNTEQRELLAPAVHDAMEEIGSMGLSAARAAVPHGPSHTGHIGGQTAALLRTRMQARPLPLWVKIETTAVRPWAGHGNYSYPKRVEWDVKLHHAGWLRGAVGQLRGRIDGALKNAGNAIARGWGA